MTNDKNGPKDWSKIAEENANDVADTDFDLDEEFEEPQAVATESGEVLEHPSYKALEEKLTEAEQKAHLQWEKAARAVAELENVRRRADREVEMAYKFNLEKFISSLLPVIDSLEQALQISTDNEDGSIQSMKQGIELTLKLFLDALNKFEVKQLEPIGEPFNPQLHEAMTMQYSPDAASGSILNVLQKGYLLNDRVIRPARVIVAKDKP